MDKYGQLDHRFIRNTLIDKLKRSTGETPRTRRFRVVAGLNSYE